MEHLSELGRLGLGSRMKRFSDYLISEVNTIYKNAGIDFEASCFPLLTLLERYGAMTLRQAEEKTRHVTFLCQPKSQAFETRRFDRNTIFETGCAQQEYVVDRERGSVDRTGEAVLEIARHRLGAFAR